MEAQTASPGPDNVIRIDSTTGLPVDNKLIPFDQSFTLILTPHDPKGVVRAFVYPVKKDKQGYTQLNVGTKPIDIIIPRIMGTQVILDFKAIPPDYNFDYCLVRQLDGDTLDQFMGYANFTAKASLPGSTTTDAEKTAMDNKYYYFVQNLKTNPGTYRVVATTYRYDCLFESTCQGDPDCRTRNVEDALIPRVQNSYDSIFNHLPALTEYAALHDDLIAVSKWLRAKKLNDQVIATLIRVLTPSPPPPGSPAGTPPTTQEQALYVGLIGMDYTYQTRPVSLDNIKQRLANLQLSYQKLSGLQDTVERLNNELYSPDPQVANANTALKAIVEEVYRCKTIIESNYNRIKKYFQTVPALVYTEWYTKNTSGIKDLKTRSGSIFSPQIGMTFIGLPKNTGGGQVIPKLAIGININFRPINKNLIRKDIPNKKVTHYLSAFVGITFGNFRDSTYQNFFASNSLLFGLNYRISRAFYFSLGGVFIRQQYKDPVINDFHTQLGVSASLMLDLDFANMASTLTSLLYK